MNSIMQKIKKNNTLKSYRPFTALKSSFRIKDYGFERPLVQTTTYKYKFNNDFNTNNCNINNSYNLKSKYYTKGVNIPKSYLRLDHSAKNVNGKYKSIEYNNDSNTLFNELSRNNSHLLKIKNNDKNSINFKTRIKIRKDKYLPKEFEEHEFLIDKATHDYIKNNTIMVDENGVKKPKLFRKVMFENTYKSQISFGESNFKTINQEEIERKIKSRKNKECCSDIFNKTSNPILLERSGEKSFIRKHFANSNDINKLNKLIPYNVSMESTLGWGFREPIPSLMNYSSINYNILNPSVKGSTKTKKEIYNECKKKDINFIPEKRQKGLTEFTDLCRVSAPNINQDYYIAYKSNNNLFKRTDQSLAEYYEMSKRYENICDKPFYRIKV